MRLIIRILINALALGIAAYLLPGLTFEGNLFNLLIVAIIFGLVNALIRPIVKLFTLPINLMTLGLFSLVINTLMLMLTIWISDAFVFTGGLINNFITAFIGAILISIISTVVGWFLPDEKK